jgi:multiple sugar transport system permease protein
MTVLTSWDPVMAQAVRAHAYGRIARRVIIYLCLIIGALLFFLPALWMISTSFKTLAESKTFPPVFIPASLQWNNFVQPFIDLNFGAFYVNSLMMTAGAMIGVLLSCTPVAYAFARLQFRGRSTLFLLVLGTMMLPDQSFVIPLYIFYSRLHWINTLLPLVVPHFFAVDAFIIFLMRQFFITIPKDLDDACKIDGGGVITCLLRIIVPLSAPLFGVVIILLFVDNWNAFFWPLLYLNKIDKYTISLGLRLFQTRYDVQMNTLMAMSLLATLPTVLLFFVAQRQFLKGIVLTGVNR